GGELRVAPLELRRAPALRHGSAAHAGDRRLLRPARRSLRAAVRRAEFDPPRRLLPARPARRPHLPVGARGARSLSRGAERDLSPERRGARLLGGLVAARRDPRAAHARRDRRQGVVLSRALLLLTLAGCQPDFGTPLSRVETTRILAVRADPA